MYYIPNYKSYTVSLIIYNNLLNNKKKTSGGPTVCLPDSRLFSDPLRCLMLFTPHQMLFVFNKTIQSLSLNH